MQIYFDIDCHLTDFFFLIFPNRVCVDSLKRYHLLSNLSARKSLFGVRDVKKDKKIGTFRLRPKQLEQLGVSVCEINYRRYRVLGLERKLQYLEESIAKHAKKKTEQTTE